MLDEGVVPHHKLARDCWERKWSFSIGQNEEAVRGWTQLSIAQVIFGAVFKVGKHKLEFKCCECRLMGNNPRISSAPFLAFSERPEILAVLYEGVPPPSQISERLLGLQKWLYPHWPKGRGGTWETQLSSAQLYVEY